MNHEKRKGRLVELLGRLESGIDVALRDMKSVLTEVQFNRYLELWDAEKSNRKIDKPPQIKKYELKIRQAYAACARFEKMRQRGYFKNDLQRTRMGDVPEHLTEKAYEYYLELIETGFGEYFNTTSTRNCPAVPSELPVVRGSKSSYQYGVKETIDKRFFKATVLQEALDSIDGVMIDVDLEVIFKEIKSKSNGGRNIKSLKTKDFKV